jgi:hypothetical protein
MPRLLILFSVLPVFACGAELKIRVCNYTPASARLQRRTVQVLDELLRRAAITPIWIAKDPPTAAMIRNSSEACQPARGVTLQLVQIEPEGLSSAALGYVELSTSTVDVTVLFQRVMDLSRVRNMEPGTLLGYVAAHEIAHVLLQRKAHSQWGLMAQKWSEGEFYRIQQHALGFDRRDAELMRAALDGGGCESR